MQNLLFFSSIGDIFKNLFDGSGLSQGSWQNYVMLLVSFILMYLAIVKKFEPLLLLPIAFGMFLINLPGAYNVLWGTYETTEVVSSEELSHLGLNLTGGWNYVDGTIMKWVEAGGTGQWVAMTSDEFTALGVNLPSGYQFLDGQILRTVELAHDYNNVQNPGLLWYLFYGVQNVIYPPLIFLGIGAMTDFGPMLANPKSFLLGAAAQMGVYTALLLAVILGFTGPQASSIAIIGGADGPTAIFLTSKLAPELLGAIAIAAYSYMALIPLIQPPIMRLITTKKEREIKMEQARPVSKREKIIFPIVVTIITCLILPSVAPLLGCLMLGNLMKECGVTDRLSDTAQNNLMNIVTIFLSTSVGATARYDTFLNLNTIKIIILGLLAFSFSTVGGLLLGKVMCKLTGGKINPLIGSAGVSAVPMAARVSQVVGQKANPSNFLLMHAMGPNVAGVIGTAVAAGTMLAMIGPAAK